MTAPAEQEKGLLTYRDLENIVSESEADEDYELANGVLLVREPAGMLHGEVLITLAAMLRKYVKQRELGTVVGDAGFILSRNPDTVRAPDIAFLRTARVRGGLPSGFFSGAPDLAVEILSPNDRFPIVEQKVQQYFNASCPLVWVIDPRERTVLIRRPDQPAQRLESHEYLDGSDVVPGFRCLVGILFAG